MSTDLITANFLKSLDWACGSLLTMYRKTGAILKDTGIRDEFGLEPIDGIFSSPEKSPLKRNGIPHDSTVTADETMDFGESNEA